MAYITKFNGNTDKTVTLGKPGDPTKVEGYFLGSKDTPDGGYGPGKLHIFQTNEGSVGIWGKTRLNSSLTPDLVGQMVLVEFTGMIQPKTKGRRPSYGFKVQHDPGNTIETGTINLNASEDSDEDSEDLDSNESSSYSSRPSTPPPAAVAPDAERRARVNALLKR